MKEDFLHYLWKFKKFDSTNLITIHGEPITIINSGQYLQLAGPDFFNGQIVIGHQKWAGNIELHIKSSDWYAHHHETDPAYENVILHVVWEYDIPVFRKNNMEIPVLVLKDFTDDATIQNYLALAAPKSWIYCDQYLASVDDFIIKHWQERLFFERLERKAERIFLDLTENGNDWEATLFGLVAKNFGLNTNGDVFSKIAKSIPFSIVRKERNDVVNLEALLYGRAGLLDFEKEDVYFKDLNNRWKYLKQKYALAEANVENLEFFKHRPDNFPTIRLSQLASLYHSSENLFTRIIDMNTTAKFYSVLCVGVSPYWQTHYQFDRESPKKQKKLGTSFIDLLLVNSIIPMKFAYSKSHEKDISGELIKLLSSLPSEQNAVIEKFSFFGIKSKNAFESQSLLQLKNEYCNKRRCLECAIGATLMKRGEQEKSFDEGRALPNGFFL